jgi:hypothetical protein
MSRAMTLHKVSRFIVKASRVNKPYQAIKKTDAYQEIKDTFTQAIADQAGYVVKNLPKLFESAGIDDDLQPLGLEQQQKLKGLISRDMPAMLELVSEFKVFQCLKDFFEWSAKTQYKRMGILVKADPTFELTNPNYIAQLQTRAAYLLNQSSLDETTLNQLIDIIATGKLDGLTNDEVASVLSDNFDNISDSRGQMIARTESANALGQANLATMVENGVKTKSWVTAGGHPCEICEGNEEDGEIPVDQPFSSGDDSEPGHPNCECYTMGNEIDLDSIDIWGGE